MRKYYIAVAILLVVSAASIAGYYLTFANNVRDVVKEQDISALSQSISTYVTANKRLPESLLDVKTDAAVKRRLDRYTYKKIGTYTYKNEVQLRYELCTTFKSEAKNSSNGIDTADSVYQSYADTYSHKAGPVCFKLYAYNPSSGSDLFRPIEKSNASTSSAINAAARDSQRKSGLRNIKTALEIYYNDNNFYPAAATWKSDLLSGTVPYAKTIPTDPLTHAEYSYIPAPANCKTDCASYTLTAQLENKKDESSDGSGHYVLTSAN